jgi:acyl-CoA thioesterase-1
LYEDLLISRSPTPRCARIAGTTRGMLVLLVALAGLACDRPSTSTADASPPATATREEPVPAERTRSAPRIVFLGDSLTAGFGLDGNQAFPAVIGRRLSDSGLEAEIVNAGVSGDTTAGGLSRVDWVLRQSPEILVVGLGGNDGLRGLSPEMTEANLREILEKARTAGARPILLGMRMPPNLGPDYVERFEAVYPRLAGELGVDLVPFMLEGVAGLPDLNLPDGIHPTAAGHQRIADNVLPSILAALRDLERD